jgi:peptidoglycan/LPS O-acetylase OafA/YrhL
MQRTGLTAKSVWWVIGSFLMVAVRDPHGLIYPVLVIGWTLVLEMFFYAVFATGLYLRVNVLRFVGIVMAALTTASFFRRPGWPALLYDYMDPLVMEFFAGMVIARLAMSGRVLPKKIAWIAAIGGIGYLAWIPLYTPPWRALELGVPATIALYGAASLEPAFRQLPGFLLFFADASYVLYLVHLPVIHVLLMVFHRLNLHNGWILLALCITVPIVVASAMRYWIEEPLTRHLRERELLHSRTSLEASAAP